MTEKHIIKTSDMALAFACYLEGEDPERICKKYPHISLQSLLEVLEGQGWAQKREEHILAVMEETRRVAQAATLKALLLTNDLLAAAQTRYSGDLREYAASPDESNFKKVEAMLPSNLDDMKKLVEMTAKAGPQQGKGGRVTTTAQEEIVEIKPDGRSQKRVITVKQMKSADQEDLLTKVKGS